MTQLLKLVFVLTPAATDIMDKLGEEFNSQKDKFNFQQD